MIEVPIVDLGRRASPSLSPVSPASPADAAASESAMPKSAMDDSSVSDSTTPESTVPDSTVPGSEVVEAVADASARFGFFQVVNHGLAPELLDSVWVATRTFFARPQAEKRRLQRSKTNARGFYDRELTKNRRDLKEVLDIGQIPCPELGDDHPANAQPVDGQNQWPAIDGFRDTMVSYLSACEELSLFLLSAFCLGLGEPARALHSGFAPGHTSFLRLNHYPLDDQLNPAEAAQTTPLGDMALHHHSDAGALTVLAQDEVGGLQVAHPDGPSGWVDVAPVPGALVINTGDMMQVWSNDRYRAALHRVLPRTDRVRFSLPYFFNPSYDTTYAPLASSVGAGDQPHYRPITWGDFRQARADGDFADYGTEIQISDYQT